jgi:hypothetical protein
VPDIEAVLNPWAEQTIERGGGGDGMFSDHPRVFVDVFAATADEARTLANNLRDALLALRGPVHGAVIRGVRCDSGPSRQPWANEAVHRRGAAYTVDLRAA